MGRDGDEEGAAMAPVAAMAERKKRECCILEMKMEVWENVAIEKNEK
jgi:hypothetical protein